jgi:hypothetical protein
MIMSFKWDSRRRALARIRGLAPMKPELQWRCHWTQCRHVSGMDKAAEGE